MKLLHPRLISQPFGEGVQAKSCSRELVAAGRYEAVALLAALQLGVGKDHAV